MSILTTPNDDARGAIESLHSYIADAGRSASEVGINVFLFARRVPDDKLADYVDAWRRLGVTDVSVDFSGCGLTTVSQHIGALQRSADRFALATESG